jgi:hypothetical protein
MYITSTKFFGSTFAVSILLFAGAVHTTVQAQTTEVALVKLNSYSFTSHSIYTRAQGGSPSEHRDTTGAQATGTGIAFANSAGDAAGSVCLDPHAVATGYAVSYVFAGYGSPRTTKAACWRDLWVEDEGPPPAYAEVDLVSISYGNADWKIPDTQTGNTWIEATINLVGTAALDAPDDALIVVDSSSGGTVQVGNTYLIVTFLDEGGIEVDGTLMDLDGPHTLDNVLYPGPSVTLTARQYIAPGVTFTTYSDHWLPSIFDIHTGPDDTIFIGAGVIGETYIESTNLKAFVGSP